MTIIAYGTLPNGQMYIDFQALEELTTPELAEEVKVHTQNRVVENIEVTSIGIVRLVYISGATKFYVQWNKEADGYVKTLFFSEHTLNQINRFMEQK